MPNRENYSALKVDQLHDPAVTNADANSASVDLQDYDSCLLVVSVGLSADTLNTTNKIELEVEESDDDTTFTDVADVDLLKFVAGTNDGTFAVIDDPAEDDAVYITGYRGNKQYVRVVLNFSGTHTTGTPIAVLAVRSHARSQPVNEPT